MRPSGQLVIAALLCLVFWILSLLMALHTREILVLSWNKIPIEHFRHEVGHAWFTKFARYSFTSPSRAVLIEDGQPLRRGNAGLDAVAYVGGGRYFLSNDELLFSTSDNSDPTKNGRKYELLCASSIDSGKVRLIFFLAVLSTAAAALCSGYAWLIRLLERIRALAAAHRKAVGAVIAIASFALPIAAFLITRLPYFLYYPVVLIRPDSYGYFDIAAQIMSGVPPDLFLRPPGYPMFIAIVLSLSKHMFSVILAQNLLSLLAALAFVYGIFISYRGAAPLAAVGMAAFIGSHVQMSADISVLSESLYAGVIIFAFSFMAAALKLRKAVFFSLAGAALGGAIYVRPDGLFVLAVFIPVIIWTSRQSLQNIAAFTVPFLSMLVILCGYNYATLGSFTPNNHSAEAAVISNEIFLETDDKYSEALNAAVRKIQSAALPEERLFLKSTWDINEYNETRNEIYARGGGDGGVTTPISEALNNPTAKEMNKVLKTLLVDAIRKNPAAFMKKCLMSFLKYFDNIGGDYDIYDSLNGSYSSLYASGAANGTDLIRYLSPQPLSYFTIETARQSDGREAVAGEYKETTLQWFHYFIYTKVHRAVFRNIFWPMAFIIAFVIGVKRLIRSRWRHTGAFIIVMMGSAALLHALGIAGAAFPNPRYSYTMEFCIYLLPLLLPMSSNESNTNLQSYK